MFIENSPAGCPFFLANLLPNKEIARTVAEPTWSKIKPLFTMHCVRVTPLVHGHVLPLFISSIFQIDFFIFC